MRPNNQPLINTKARLPRQFSRLVHHAWRCRVLPVGGGGAKVLFGKREIQSFARHTIPPAIVHCSSHQRKKGKGKVKIGSKPSDRGLNDTLVIGGTETYHETGHHPLPVDHHPSYNFLKTISKLDVHHCVCLIVAKITVVWYKLPVNRPTLV